ncbi:MAG: diacylglycerol/lipid kinase family protein [Kiloniellaceae bacterium]
MTESRPEHGAARQGRRLMIIHNPAAGSHGGRFAETTMRLAELGCRLEVRRTGAHGDAEDLAREAAGCDLVVAAGGDGTINEVINGLVAAGAGLPLAILPLGTANVLAAEIGLDLNPAALAKVIARGAPRPVCLGRLSAGQGAGRLFAMMAGAGFDAHAVAGVNLALKRVFGKLAYAAEVLRQLAVFPFPRYRVVVDGEAFDAASVVAAKGRYYAGRYVLAPEARLEDPRLHVCIFGRGGRWAALRYGLAMEMRRLDAAPGYRIVPGRVVAIEGPAGDPLQADGDIVGRLPVEIEIVPDALRLVTPIGPPVSTRST